MTGTLRTYLIKATSCHDDTAVLLDLTSAEADVAWKIADALAVMSTCDCQPTLKVKVATSDEVAEYTLEPDEDET